MNIITPLLADFYKVGHPFQYPRKTEFVYSNLTPRQSRIEGVNEMVVFGLQYFIKRYLLEHFNEEFFGLPIGKVMDLYRRRLRTSVGELPRYDHIEELHATQYLPLKIKALREGTPCPMRVPCVTLMNTQPHAYWLTNFVETIMSATIWQPCTSATIAHEYRKLLDRYARETGMPMEFVQWQGHDFSFRGMSSLESAITSGMGHLLSFTGTDTIPAIDGLEAYYNADCEKELIGGSVNATEHSVMCAGGECNELETIRRIVTEVYPKGIVSVVSDTWDLWQVCMEYMRVLKPEIMARDGKVVIRPDSGNPCDIVCGDPQAKEEAPRKGVIECLWDVFGGTKTSAGYRLLDSHIGSIYGDSITRSRADEICRRLKEKGFASQQVLGIGSYTYQYNTRDTFGTAMKATHVVIDEKPQAIFKKPKTDNGVKNSAQGLIEVRRENGKLVMYDNVSFIREAQGELLHVFLDGKLPVGSDQSLAEIRERLRQAREQAANN